MKNGFVCKRRIGTVLVAISPCMIVLYSGLSAEAGSVTAAVVNGQGVFLKGGALFSPRGVNFERLSETIPKYPQYHVNFDPGSYDASDVAGEMQYIASSGYNVVRVNLSSYYADGGYGLSAQGVGTAYMQNLQNFLEDAYSNGLQVILCSDALPSNYDQYLSQSTNTEYTKISGPNTVILSPGFANGLAKNFSDILTYLKANSSTAILSIMAVEALNEGDLYPNCAPFSANQCLTDAGGTMTASPGPAISSIEVNSVTYSMSSAADRQNLADGATFNLISAVRAAVRSVDSSILVGLGASTISETEVNPSARFNGLMPTDTDFLLREPVRPYMIGTYSSADFVDIHVYPQGSNWTLQADLSSDEITPSTTFSKPLLMGEYGVSEGTYTTLSNAASALASELANSCGYGFSGWNFWTWDTTNQVSPDWTAKQQNGAINGVVSPSALPTVCAPIPTGLFQVPPAIGYSNGSRYCVFSSFASFEKETGRTSNSGITTYSRFPALMPYDGSC